MKKILVPTDFSPIASKALDFAIQTAKLLQLEVHLIHAFNVVDNVYIDYMGVNWEFTQFQLDDMYERLYQLKIDIEKREGILVNTAVYKNTVKEGIIEAVTDNHIDLIVMGTLGASGIKEKLWGTQTGHVIGKTTVPLIVIPEDYNWKKPEKFLLLTNHFESDPVILDFLFQLAELFQAQVHIAVFTDKDDIAITILEHGRRTFQYEYMLKQRYKNARLAVTHLFGTEFENTLQTYIMDNEIDMLAMITHKRKFWARIFHPSMTKKMSYHTKIPLLTFSVSPFHSDENKNEVDEDDQVVLPIMGL